MRFKKFSFFVFLLATTLVFGQQNDNSPYSRFGIGDQHDQSFNHLRQMGGMGASYVDNFHINTINPASYAFLNSTAFDIGVFAKYTSLKDSKNTNAFWTGNLDYIGLAFPIYNPINEIYDGKKRNLKLGMAFSLAPYSVVNYNITSFDSLSYIENVAQNYSGKGGTYKVQWGNALKYKNFGVGLNLNYIFGTVSYNRALEFLDHPYAFNDYYSNDIILRGFTGDLGFLYSKVLNSKAVSANSAIPSRKINIGFHITPSTGFSTNGSVLNVQTQSAIVTLIDTILYASDLKQSGKLPISLGFGATYYIGEKYCFGFNAKTTTWSKFYNEATDTKEGDLVNSSRYSVGGYIRPNYKSYTSFLQRVYYRYGLFYNEDPRLIEGKQLSSYGLNFGLGMPFVYQRKISHVNIGAEIGVRGQKTVISENYVKLSIGVTFNDDEWFLKRKYN